MALLPFVTTQALSDRLGRDVTTDPGAVSAVDAACQICRTIAEQDFNAATVTISLDGSGTDCLLLPQRPVGGAGTVTVNGGTITDYMLTANGMLVRGTAGARYATGGWPVWPLGRQNVTVTFDYGYQVVDVPSDVQGVALNIAERLAVQGAAGSETVGDVAITYKIGAADLSQNELRILHKYRGAV